MYQSLIESFLIHYQPKLMEELLQAGTLQSYLAEQEEAMGKAKAQIVEQIREKFPQISQLQLEMEAEQTVREMFLTPEN